MFPRRPLEAIDDGIRRDSQQPGHEWNAAPFITLQIAERFVKHFRSQVFGGGAIVHATGDEAVNPCEMQFVKCVEFRGVVLRRLDKQALLRLCGARLLRRSALGRSTLPSGASGGLHRSVNNNWPPRKKLRHLLRVLKACGNAEAGLQPGRAQAETSSSVFLRGSIRTFTSRRILTARITRAGSLVSLAAARQALLYPDSGAPSPAPAAYATAIRRAQGPGSSCS